MTELHELPPDVLLEKLQQRGEEWALAKNQAALLEGSYDRLRAAKANVFKAGGETVEGAKNQALNDPAVIQAFTDWLDAELKKDQAYLRLEKIRTGIDLFRTEMANRRRV